jgi:hypothetical protein
VAQGGGPEFKPQYHKKKRKKKEKGTVALPRESLTPIGAWHIDA